MGMPIYDPEEWGKETVYPLHLPCPRCNKNFRVGQIIKISRDIWPSPNKVISWNIAFVEMYRLLGIDLARMILHLVEIKNIPMNVHSQCEERKDTRLEFLIYSRKYIAIH
jgi:hypothetical protein